MCLRALKTHYSKNSIIFRNELFKIDMIPKRPSKRPNKSQTRKTPIKLTLISRDSLCYISRCTRRITRLPKVPDLEILENQIYTSQTYNPTEPNQTLFYKSPNHRFNSIYIGSRRVWMLPAHTTCPSLFKHLGCKFKSILNTCYQTLLPLLHIQNAPKVVGVNSRVCNFRNL